MTILITHAGTPLLVIQSQAAPESPPIVPPLVSPGSIAMDPARGGLALSVPPDFFAGSATVSLPGIPPEVLAHLRTLPGLWCVATDPTGLPLAEWPACISGQAPDSVLALLPALAQQAVLARRSATSTTPFTTAASQSPYAIALADGIHSVACAHSWPPGTHPPTPNFVPPGIAAAHAALSSVAVLPYPPAGAFFGAVASPLPPSPVTPPQLATQLAARLAAAIETLKTVTLNGQPVGAGLTGVMNWALSVNWSAATPPAARLTPTSGTYAHLPAPPPCGWSPSSRTLFLSPDLPQHLDAAYLAAGLYHAHVSLSGQSATSRLAAYILHPSTPLPDLGAECRAAAAEAARAWILLSEVLHALPDPTARTHALAAFADLPYGHEALIRFRPPSASAPNATPRPTAILNPDAYAATLDAAIAQAANDIGPILTPTITALHAEAASLRAAWHDPSRRANPPLPPRPAPSITARILPSTISATLAPSAASAPRAEGVRLNTAPVAHPDANAASQPPEPYVAAGVVSLPPDAPPTIGYMAPSPATHSGPLMVYRHPAAPTGAVLIDRADGIRIIVNGITANILTALSAAKNVLMIVYDLEGSALTEPQPVPVALYDDR